MSKINKNTIRLTLELKKINLFVDKNSYCIQQLAYEEKALITGITGQDGSYLAEFLLEKNYEVHGIKRRASSLNTQRIDHIYVDPHVENQNLILHYGDLTDSSNITRILSEIEPDEVYNLGAQSHVAVSLNLLNIPPM